ncbi:MAG: hypothetical protein EOM24_04200 [Chloroflexia bacterium]|nr:hypothetical protein [Chloroflexia bacterium]
MTREELMEIVESTLYKFGIVRPAHLLSQAAIDEVSLDHGETKLKHSDFLRLEVQQIHASIKRRQALIEKTENMCAFAWPRGDYRAVGKWRKPNHNAQHHSAHLEAKIAKLEAEGK